MELSSYASRPNEYIMNGEKSATFSNLASSRKFYSYANLLETKSSLAPPGQPNGRANEDGSSKPYVLSNSIIQYYDEKPTLLSSQSSYYLSSFQDDDETSSSGGEDSSNELQRADQSPPFNHLLEHRSLKSNFELNNLFKSNPQPAQLQDSKPPPTGKPPTASNKGNQKDLSPELNENIKNLSQFLIKSRSRSSSPRASFKNRKSFNQKHNNRVQQHSNQNDILHSNSSIKSTISSTNSINSQDDQFYLLNNQILANRVEEQYIKENYGLLSTNELKQNGKDVEEEPVFNAFDLKSLRYSFNKVLKRRGGLWSSQALSPTNTPDYPLGNGRDGRQGKLSIDLARLPIHHSNNNNDSQLVNKKTMNKDTKLMDLIADNQKVYWCEMPIVVESGILERLDAKQRQLQEAHFELIASEASYVRSLNLLIKNFYMNTFFCDTNIIDARKKEDLFSNIVHVVEVSNGLFKALERRWLESVNIQTFCDLIYKFSLKKFEVYVNYCRFKKRQERTLKQLQDKPKFMGILRLLESDSKCQGLSLHSFLLLPVQRITRYRLLIEAILNRTDPQSDTYQLTQKCLRECNKIVQLCNAAARQYEEYENLYPKLKFTNVKWSPLMLCTPRWLIAVNEVTKIKINQENQSTTIIGSFRHPNLIKSNVCLILLSDLIVIAKKKSDDIYIVIDFCNRNAIDIFNLCPNDENRLSVQAKMCDNFKHLVKVVFLGNYANKKVEYGFNFSSESEKQNWLDLTSRTEKKMSRKQKSSFIDTFDLKSFEKQSPASDHSNDIIDNSLGQRTVRVMKQHSFNQPNESKDSQELSDDAECTNEIFI